MTLRRHDISKDELRRELRSMGADHDRDLRAMRTTMGAMFESDASEEQKVAAVLGRRRFLTLGGASVAMAAVIAACGDEVDTGPSRVGNAPTTTALPDAVVNDVVLLRTASSLEHSAISVYDTVLADAALLDPVLRDMVARFRDDHAGHAALFEQLTVEAGGAAWTCGNPRIDETLVTPVLRSITGADATDVLPARQPSDDMHRDVLNFAHGLETLAGATYQALVPILSLPSMRVEAITVGTHEVRHAALLALAITGVPEGYVDPSDITAAGETAPTATAAPTTTQNIAAPADGEEAPAEAPASTPIPSVYAIPSQFGSLGATPVVLGAPDGNGVRLTVRLETPSLNTLVYEYLTPEC